MLDCKCKTTYQRSDAGGCSVCNPTYGLKQKIKALKDHVAKLDFVVINIGEALGVVCLGIDAEHENGKGNHTEQAILIAIEDLTAKLAAAEERVKELEGYKAIAKAESDCRVDNLIHIENLEARVLDLEVFIKNQNSAMFNVQSKLAAAEEQMKEIRSIVLSRINQHAQGFGISTSARYSEARFILQAIDTEKVRTE